ncbi:DUF664 domain-containing protein [Kribbella capetownensis]|uniref:DUF664 domain-containing protein n=1 Tax=Kribbella capetownensis TaxID=1572659 RepID=A0A4R0JS84_9ACTN|nr:DUF664 domain-containing protein [Kribbella capetownensis]TCC44955.1 DUF664 domain-containing protein [Kribbella capetownensis]
MDWRELQLSECLRGTDAEMLQFAVDRVRQQFAWKTGDLDAEQFRRTHPPSTMTLAGLVKHMTFVEDGFTAQAAEQPLGPPWDTRSWVENDEWGWESAVTDDPEQLYAEWYAAAKRSQATWAQLCADGGLDVVIDTAEPAWAKTRRRFLIDLLEEYLKHTGHADLLREAIDGLRGNDPS